NQVEVDVIEEPARAPNAGMGWVGGTESELNSSPAAGFIVLAGRGSDSGRSWFRLHAVPECYGLTPAGRFP
ncbi:MAG TPA: hypothetical protein VK535_11005, partial [Gemmatimonadales bacterium]|nr:hypothetical protein [Gemmatimonadales bacterium]